MCIGNRFVRSCISELRSLIAIAIIAIHAPIEALNFTARFIAQASGIEFFDGRDAAFARDEIVPESRYIVAERRHTA